jgi:methylase of polypeptide subunit release factors
MLAGPVLGGLLRLLVGLTQPRLVLEIGDTQGEQVRKLAEANGFEAEVAPDLTGRDRVLIARS